MDIIQTPREMQEKARQWRRDGARVGFVPTMGALHEAHLSLIRIALEHADVTVVSVFVNPKQFGPSGDFEKYPRDVKRDETLCKHEGVSAVFCPSVEDMYPAGHTVYVEEPAAAKTLEGARRPAHFRGVLTVVAKLLNIVLPDVTVFGEKDAQQLFLVRRMVDDLNIPTEVVSGPIVRDEDGLALSSRNAYLSPEERRDATCLNAALGAALKLYRGGERDTQVIRRAMSNVVDASATATTDYAEIVDRRTFEPMGRAGPSSLAVMAARVGTTRLLDNAALDAEAP